jgi:hypothetical protein
VDATPPAAPPNELEIRDPDTLFVYKNFLTLGGVFGAGYSLDVFQKPEDASDWRCYRRDHTLDDNSVIVGVSEPVLWASGAEGVAPNGYAYLASEALRIAAVHYPTVPPPPTAAAVRKTRKRRDKAERAEAEKAAADRAG